MADRNPQDLYATLKAALDEAEWTWLIPHAERGALFLVSSELDLIEVGVKLVQDDSPVVGEWLRTQKLRRPDESQVKSWEAQPAIRFLCLIVQPYVLIQSKAH